MCVRLVNATSNLAKDLSFQMQQLFADTRDAHIFIYILCAMYTYMYSYIYEDVQQGYAFKMMFIDVCMENVIKYSLWFLD